MFVFFFFFCFITLRYIGSRFHFDRYGLVPRSSPRQADLIFTASTVTMKMAEDFLAMEAITGGMFIQYRFFLIVPFGELRS